MDLDIPKTGMDENFTRSYYTSSGRWDFGALAQVLLRSCLFVVDHGQSRFTLGGDQLEFQLTSARDFGEGVAANMLNAFQLV